MIAVYPGCFDPITFGHMDVIDRSLKVFDTLVVALPEISDKVSLMSVSQRLDLLNKVYGKNSRVEVACFPGLLVDWMQEHGYGLLVRGIRDSVDMANEWRMAHCNKVLSDSIETFFLASSPSVSHISSTLVRQIIACGGDIKPFVPAVVAETFGQ